MATAGGRNNSDSKSTGQEDAFETDISETDDEGTTVRQADVTTNDLKEINDESQSGSAMADGTSENPISAFIEVQRALKGMSYPADKAALLESAKSNGAGDEVIAALKKLADGEYNGPADVSEGIGNE